MGRLAVQAPYAYVTDGGSLRVLDISTPTKPTEVSRLKLVDNKLAGMSLAMATGIAVAGQHAYVCLDTKGFCVVDVSNPKAPKKIGANEDVGAERVAVAGNYAYVTYGEGGVALSVVDVSDPKRPKRLSTYGNWVTDEGVKRLQQALPNCRIER